MVGDGINDAGTGSSDVESQLVRRMWRSLLVTSLISGELQDRDQFNSRAPFVTSNKISFFSYNGWSPLPQVFYFPLVGFSPIVGAHVVVFSRHKCPASA